MFSWKFPLLGHLVTLNQQERFPVHYPIPITALSSTKPSVPILSICLSVARVLGLVTLEFIGS